jgi:hypothetical protein
MANRLYSALDEKWGSGPPPIEYRRRLVHATQSRRSKRIDRKRACSTQILGNSVCRLTPLGRLR